MKIIHTSDLHIDSPLTTHLSSDKVRERRRELFSTFAAMIDECTRIEARIFIIAGDLFDSARVTKSSRARALGLIEKNSHISFFYLPGNHERTVLLDSGDLPENLFVFGEGWTYFSSGDLVIAGRQTTSPDMFDTLSLPKEKKNIVVLHGELREHSDENGKIGRRDAAGRNADYLALGHYHSYSSENIDSRCVAVYSGTPEGRGFDEAGDKGFSLISVDSLGVSHRFMRFARRTLRVVSADVSYASDAYSLEETVAEACEGIPSTDLVRVVLTGKHPLGAAPDTTAIKHRFEDKFYYFEVKDESRLRFSSGDYENDRSLKGEFIRLVTADETLSDKEKEEIIDCGLSALLGEEAL